MPSIRRKGRATRQPSPDVSKVTGDESRILVGDEAADFVNNLTPVPTEKYTGPRPKKVDSWGECPLDRDMEPHGWENIATGGGCTAYFQKKGDISFMITDDAEVPTSMGQKVSLAIYSGDAQEQLGWFDDMTVREAVALVNKYNSGY